MRIVHVDPETGWRGGQSQVFALMQELRRAGHSSILAAPRDGELASRALESGFVVANVGCRFGHDPRAGFALRRLCAERHPDIVHLHTARALTFVGFAPRSVVRVLTRRMDTPPRGAGWYVRWLYRSLDEVLAISEAARRGLVARGIDPRQIEIVPSGVDTAALQPGDATAARATLGLGPGFCVAIVGGLHARKGHAVLLEAVAQLPEEDRRGLQVLVAGSGPEEAMLRERAHSLGIEKALRWLGEVADVRPVLLAADLVAQPSLAEGLGVAALEAMACGRPVVASAVGGLSESIRQGREGWLVPAGDAGALAAVLLSCSRDRTQLRGLGAQARLRGLEFSTVRMAAATLSVYQRSLARRALGADAIR